MGSTLKLLEMPARMPLQNIDAEDQSWNGIQSVMYSDAAEAMKDHDTDTAYYKQIFIQSVETHVEKWMKDMIELWYERNMSNKNITDMLFKPNVTSGKISEFIKQSRKVSLNKDDKKFIERILDKKLPEYCKSFFFQPDDMSTTTKKLLEQYKEDGDEVTIQQIIMLDEKAKIIKDLNTISQMGIQIGVCVAGLIPLTFWANQEGERDGTKIFKHLFPALPSTGWGGDANKAPYASSLSFFLRLCEFHTITHLELLGQNKFKNNHAQREQKAHTLLLDAMLEHVERGQKNAFLDALEYHGLITPISYSWAGNKVTVNRFLRTLLGQDKYSPIIVGPLMDAAFSMTIRLIRIHCAIVATTHLFNIIRHETVVNDTWTSTLRTWACTPTEYVHLCDPTTRELRPQHMDASYTSTLAFLSWFQMIYDIAMTALTTVSRGRDALRRRLRISSSDTLFDLLEVVSFCNNDYSLIDVMLQRLLLPFSLMRCTNLFSFTQQYANTESHDNAVRIRKIICGLTFASAAIAVGTYTDSSWRGVAPYNHDRGYLNTTSTSRLLSKIPPISWGYNVAMDYTARKVNESLAAYNLSNQTDISGNPLFTREQQYSAWADTFTVSPFSSVELQDLLSSRTTKSVPLLKYENATQMATKAENLKRDPFNSEKFNPH